MSESLPIVFIFTSIILIVTPGQDLILVMSRSISQGWRAGVTTAGGVSIGLLGHTLMAALGLGALLRTSVVVFTIMKLVGAVYLVYLGIKLFRSGRDDLSFDALPSIPLGRMFCQGALSNLSNPKIAVFYFAYLPQFLPRNLENPTFLLFLLGSAFAVLTFFVKGPIGYGAGMLSGWLRSRPSVVGWTHRISGMVLVGLGLRLALERKGQ